MLMETSAQKRRPIVVSSLMAAWMLFFGILVSRGGYGTIRGWRFIGAAYAACGVLWMLSGPAMLVAGLWVLATLGQHRIALWMGGAAAAVAGAVLVAGVLTHVVPCSGPS
jgi:hypothetical protein